MSRLKKKSLRLGSEWIGRRVLTIIDRPIGSYHPRFQHLRYPLNYGYIPGTLSGDGEAVDVYVIGEDRVFSKLYVCVLAIIHREDDDEDKLVAARTMKMVNPEYIMSMVRFVEQYFTVSIETAHGCARFKNGFQAVAIDTNQGQQEIN